MKWKVYLSIFTAILITIGITYANMDAEEPKVKNNPVLQEESTSKDVPDPGLSDRGKLLYNNHCLECHNPLIHDRHSNKVNSIDDVRQWVIRWSRNLNLDWRSNDIDTVTNYLNHHYYHFPQSE